MSFADNVRARLPDGMHLPDAFAQTFDWAEAQGFALSHTRPRDDPFQQQSLSIYPADIRDTPGASHVVFAFEAGPPLHAPPPEVAARIVTLAQIAGDGGTLSLWLDPSGAQRIVVFDHGIPFVLTDDPVVALQFLAMGYPEPAALADLSLGPADHAALEGHDRPLPPDAFRRFLTTTFGVTIPERASDLGLTRPADTATDPLRDWLDDLMPAPEAGPMPGSSPDNPFIITRELRDVLGEEGVAQMRSAFDYVIEEE